MKKKIRYTDEPMGKVRIVPNFLPSPEELAKRLKVTKVTIALSAESILFFKAEAEKHHLPYQLMIRQVLDDYVAHQQKL
jgi:predicted DNA binding CopG/RHH family protein